MYQPETLYTTTGWLQHMYCTSGTKAYFSVRMIFVLGPQSAADTLAMLSVIGGDTAGSLSLGAPSNLYTWSGLSRHFRDKLLHCRSQ